MAARTRLLVPTAQTARVPRTAQEWGRLMQEVIVRAESLEDRRLPGLRLALVSGISESHLRKMGIISTVDLEREFPPKS